MVMNMNFKHYLMSLLSLFTDLWHDQRANATNFDIVGIIFMWIAIYVGNIMGPMLGGTIGITAGLFATFITGFVIYLIFCLVTGTKMSIWGAVLFSLAVYGSVLVTGLITGYAGFITGWMSTIVQAIVLSLIFGWIAPKDQTANLPVTVQV